MKDYIKYVKGNWTATILAPILMMIDAIGGIVQPYFMSKIIDVGIANQDMNYIIRTGIIMVLFAIVAMIAGFGCTYFSAKAAYGFSANLREDLIAKVQAFSFSNIEKFRTSSLITRITNDVQILAQLYQMLLRIVIRAPFMFIGGIIMTLILGKKLTIILVVLIPILLIFIISIIKMVTPLFEIVQSKIDKVNAVIRENLSAIRVVKAFVRENHERKRFEKANTELKNISTDSFGKMMILMPVIYLVMNLAVASVLWFGGQFAIKGDIEVGALSSMIVYITMTLSSLVMMAMVFVNLARAEASSNRILEVLHEEVDIINNEKIKDKQITKGDIIFNIKKFAYKDSKESALRNIKFEVKAGDRLAIIGGTGSGKSTLVNLLPRFYDIKDGYIKIDGQNIKDYDIKHLRDNIGMVLQSNRLFKGTIKENLLWGNKNATDEEIISACKTAQIHDFIMSLPKQYESHVEQKATNFSGGQKQRLCIARALIKNPKILILDDSVSALDATTEKNLTKSLDKNYDNSTVFVITQRISSCKNSNYIVVMDNGEIVGIGTHKQLLKNNKVYKEINDSQQEVTINE